MLSCGENTFLCLSHAWKRHNKLFGFFNNKIKTWHGMFRRKFFDWHGLEYNPIKESDNRKNG